MLHLVVRYVLVKLLADTDEPLVVDKHELLDAKWMSPETIKSLVPEDPKVKHTTVQLDALRSCSCSCSCS